MKLKHNSLFFGGQENIEAHCSATIVRKSKGHQQARKVDRPKGIAEKLRRIAKLQKIAKNCGPQSPLPPASYQRQGFSYPRGGGVDLRDPPTHIFRKPTDPQMSHPLGGGGRLDTSLPNYHRRNALPQAKCLDHSAFRADPKIPTMAGICRNLVWHIAKPSKM